MVKRSGQVLGLVPGTSDWYNVQYDGENEILSLNLLADIDKGDLTKTLFKLCTFICGYFGENCMLISVCEHKLQVKEFEVSFGAIHTM